MDRNTIRPQAGVRTQPQPTQPTHVAAVSKKDSYKRPGIARTAIAAILIALALYAAWMLWPSSSQQPNSGKYQAVFLQTGAVYFGKLKNVDGAYLQLERAYYTKQQDLPADATDEQKAAVANNVSLVKVGDEVYGPESTMSIRAEQVLFWQNLKSDSKVSKAIDSAK